MRYIIFVSGLLLSSLLSQSQWTSGSGLIYYNAGNVGIGMSNPQQKLHVAGTIKAGSFTFISETNNGLGSVFGNNLYAGVTNNTLVRQNNSDPGNYMYIRYDRGITFGTGVTSTAGTEVSDIINERMRIDLNGNVGIGTTNPGSYRLAVEGTIGARKVKVTLTGWPDYVFHPSYSLRPLSDLEKYIREHGHLPEVPSAEEVEENGLDLGDTQAVLLKKIEELTLYVIELHKQVEELKQQTTSPA